MVLAELAASREHLTAAEIFDRVRRTLPRISLGTVYRNLEVLVSEGRVVKLPGSEPGARYDGAPAPHDHIRCRRCGNVSDVPSQALPVPEQVPPGFLIESRRLEYVGLCADCRPAASVVGGDCGPEEPRVGHGQP
ncbi:MAG: transcriptional repressor [bacterium]|nr:transcriptional repressor [bacterium]